MSKLTTTIQPADRNPEFEVVVEYAFHKADDGGREYPSTPAYIEIISVMHNGADIEQYLSDDIMTTIEQEVEADMESAHAMAMDRRDEQVREDRQAMWEEA